MRVRYVGVVQYPQPFGAGCGSMVVSRKRAKLPLLAPSESCRALALDLIETVANHGSGGCVLSYAQPKCIKSSFPISMLYGTSYTPARGYIAKDVLASKQSPLQILVQQKCSSLSASASRLPPRRQRRNLAVWHTVDLSTQKHHSIFMTIVYSLCKSCDGANSNHPQSMRLLL